MSTELIYYLLIVTLGITIGVLCFVVPTLLEDYKKKRDASSESEEHESYITR